ncbi:MAG: hypothetical protein ACFCVB_14245 [Nodosilinea sp.]
MSSSLITRFQCFAVFIQRLGSTALAFGGYGSEPKIRRSIEVQEELFEGAAPIHIAVVFVVQRSNLEQPSTMTQLLGI